MTGNESLENHPFADSRVRSLVGLMGGITIAVVAVLFLEGVIMWIALGIAVMDVIITPYLLKMVVEEAREADDSAAVGE